jgi:hypothetical protein
VAFGEIVLRTDCDGHDADAEPESEGEALDEREMGRTENELLEVEERL